MVAYGHGGVCAHLCVCHDMVAYGHRGVYMYVLLSVCILGACGKAC